MSLNDLLRPIPNEPDPEAEQRRAEARRRCLEEVQLVRSRLQVAPNSVTDREILSCIDCLFHDVYSTTPFEQEYDQLIEALSFTKRALGDLEAATFKRAWTNFLEENETYLGWAVHEGFVQWYWSKEMPLHEIAVLEHLLTRYRQGELTAGEGFLEEWLLSLSQLCVRQNLASRARHVAELIGDYYEDGFVSPSGYAEVLAYQGALRYRELMQAIEADRLEVKRRLRSDYGHLFENLHETTRSLVIDAELWSKAHLREIEPAAGPRRWALAVEAEFNEKVFQPNCKILESALSKGVSDKRLRLGKSCSVGQIAHLIRFSRDGNVVGSSLVREVFARLCGGPQFRGLDLPEILVDHRDQIAHVTERGLYTRTDCDAFVRSVRDSGWVFRFLEAIQPR